MSSDFISPVEDLLEDISNGRMIIVVDDEDRENEGDIIVAGQFATPECINFMITHARGLVCLALTSQRCNELDLPLIHQNNKSKFDTAFTISIEAKNDVTTGISASDRAKAIAVAIDSSKTKEDLVTPGHIFPLRARNGGTIVRSGHTEAAVDLARLAGLNSSGVICEILKPDGTMARLDYLIEFAKRFNLKIGTIADIIAYRLRNEKLINKSSAVNCNLYGQDWNMILYDDLVHEVQHVALSKINNQVNANNHTYVRMHSYNMIQDIIYNKQQYVEQSIKLINKQDSGTIVILNNMNKVLNLEQDTLIEKDHSDKLLDYGIGAQILVDLGIKNIILLSSKQYKNNKQIIGLDGYDIHIVGTKYLNNKD